MADERGLPEAIVLDNGPEFRGRALAAWSEERGVRLEFNSARQARSECLHRKLQRPTARRMSERELGLPISAMHVERSKLDGRITTSNAHTVR